MKRALVTGGSGSSGTAICRQLASDGHHVFVHANGNLEQAQRLTAAIITAGGSAQAVAFDVTDPAQTSATLQDLLTDGPIQVVINNAGIHDDAIMPAMDIGQWSRVIDVSLHGFFNLKFPVPIARF